VRASTPRSAGPTALAALALAAALALLWWALLGPRPDKAEIDRASLGLEFREHHEADGATIPAFLSLADPQSVKTTMAGQQGALGGRLGTPLVDGEGGYSAPVLESPDDDLEWETTVVGVVEWNGPDDAEGFRRCSFLRPVPVEAARQVAEQQSGEVTTDALAMVGRCDGDEPVLFSSLVRHEIADVDLVGGLLGRQADAVDLPAGVVELRGADRVTVRDTHDEEPLAVAVYPRPVAETSFEFAFPDNPHADAGPWYEPVYPALAPVDGRLLWVMPISPPDGSDMITGYATIAADRVDAGQFNPIDVYWFEEPRPGPGLLAERAQRLLEEIDPEAAARDVSVFLTLPDADGGWHGRVAQAPSITGGDPEVLYYVTVDADAELCLVDLDGHEAGCRPPGDR
jgi:hypothetical protein